MSEYRGMNFEQEVALEIALRNHLEMKDAIAEKDLLFGNTPTTLVVMRVDLQDTSKVIEEKFSSEGDFYARYSDIEGDCEGFRDALWNDGSVETSGDLYLLVKI